MQLIRVVFLAIPLVTTPLAARPFLTEETERLLVEAVEAAAQVDLFHARCRADTSKRRTENLNKLLASKFKLTILDVQDDLFPEQSYRRARERLERDFMMALRAAGGCQTARDDGIAEEMRDRYQALYGAIERLP